MPQTHIIKAILGPTNTGKTHLALERMMAHGSGIIGFPLRLLAKENYDRMVAIKGEKNVALITGEEKIIPPKAKWFSCTVEAMPTHISVDFIAIDEIQLCADPDRGHIFTDRLLHCRGLIETMFLGADTITPILKQLIPEIEIDTRPRLSSLSYTGFDKFTRLPPRSAIVAFSANEVYAIAEFIKRRHGGCAIVMGRLSPRTRNAQMELYQNKEVDYLVATDAIGMGLNMNVNHVAFASLSKYDGRQLRHLFPSEVAQIAGRAGRGMQDGTFGTTANCSGMSEKLVNAVENHNFDSLKQIYWRNHTPDFSNPSRLLSSLSKSAPLKTLITSQHATDLQTLIYLIQDPEIMAACTTIEKTQLLWENCQIPDFKKLGNDNHARICKKTFLFLLKQGHIPETWMHQQIEQLNHPHGDIDTLMQRLSGVRICSYIAAKNQWLENAIYWQAQAREVEDSLSDSLHTALMSRFVNQRATSLLRNLKNEEQNNLFTSISTTGQILIEGQSIGSFKGFSIELQEAIPQEDYKLALKSIRRNIRLLIPQQLQKFINAKPEEFHIDIKAKLILWENTNIARLRKGHDLFHPEIQLIENEFLENDVQQIVLKKLQDYLNAQIKTLCPALFTLQHNTKLPALIRGLFHQISENGGILWQDKPFQLSKSMLKILSRHGINQGQYAFYVKDIFKAHKVKLRALIYHVYYAPIDPETIPLPHLVHIPAITQKADLNFYHYLGWIKADNQFIRLDIAEKIGQALHNKIKNHPAAIKKQDISPLPYINEALPSLLKSLNLFVQKAQIPSKKLMGPPAPLLIANRPFQIHKKVKKKPFLKRKNLTHSVSDLQQLYNNNRHD
ncbi:helicase-related protein [Commensalibacter papalotli (ex Botero et al. 2024)]|uniref:Superfamily II RNA helicase (Dob10) (PDB:4A4Z) n=1 Tax=Commensalibacter papalotli (ex Botero et al. 2024) TaxID=2972766 RepID=A0ABM9HJG8_9PROT|nr:helicase-related protein [Commensalibacter papalotli (ex Botero et al. 2024)]CAI3924188.1 Superfamily II RNA helicase (Dob10) (PDB:4A4Z) [Commensalibacter papalotli (ex Botero et al. 2024)]CAI3927869.1 Superfamily II RNA helicase (Dob10) (PDB:4A4Z) [Commensalibacter papalotli (ex Botero et al. 2024)]